MPGADLFCYAPFAIAEECSKRGDDEWKPTATEFEGAVCFCDVSGFTALTERLRAEGEDGAEKLVNFLNEYFGKLVSIIVKHKGDVMKFAGDALLTIFRRNGDEPLNYATQRAAEAAWEVMQEMNVGDASHPRLHIGIGSGKMALFTVGGTYGRCEFLVAGRPLVDLGPSVTAASPDFTVLSATSWKLVSDSFSGEELDDGLVKLTGVTNPLPGETPVDLAKMREAYDPLAADNIRAFVPGAVRRAKGSNVWLAELRQATVLFFNITGINFVVDDANSVAPCLELLNSVIIRVQTALYRYEGAINKILLDDKGFVILAAFGLPPLSHPDDAARGILAALDARSSLEEINVSSTIGITTGEVFCGIVGSSVRREYTVMGDNVNTAARIMCANVEGRPVLCDDSTRMAAIRSGTRKFEFDLAAEKKFKGKKEALKVYAPKVSTSGPSSMKMKGLTTMAKVNVNIVGRTKETMLLQGQIATLAETGESHVIVFEGERGMGKSRLLEEGKVLASERESLMQLACVGDPLETSSPFRAWTGVFLQLFGLSVGLKADEIAAGLEAEKAKLDTKLADQLPLLAPVFAIDIPDTEQTAKLRRAERPARTRSFLLALLEYFTAKERVVLFAQEYHFFDIDSKKLLLSWTGTRAMGLLAIVSTRSLVGGEDTAFSVLCERPTTTRARLTGLEKGALKKLICQRLDVDDVPELVADTITKRCGGNPYFGQELAYAMLKEGYVEVKHRKCVLARNIVSADDVQLPDTMNGVVTGRLDRLPPNYLQTVKIASALGSEFDVNTLHAVFPPDEESGRSRRLPKNTLLSDLDYLVQDDFLERIDQGDGGGMDYTVVEVFAFKNQFIQHCAYSLMLYTQRAELHQRIAEHYASLTPAHAYKKSVAHHWRLADVRKPDVAEKAVTALHDAAADAIAYGQVPEAVEFLRSAIFICDSMPGITMANMVEEMLEKYDKNDKGQRGAPALTPKEAADAAAQFSAFDTDGNGSLDLPELKAVFRALGSSIDDDELAKLVKESDLRRQDVIEKDEFLEMVSKAKYESHNELAVALRSVSLVDTEASEKHEQEMESLMEEPMPEKSTEKKEKKGGCCAIS